ncbi:hypothetical protein MCSV2_170012 [Mucispirillum schaedleri ASF457]|nr:hypothetical protein MCSV2_170012 [Mucispirillum schaedleri ASF457]
MDQKWSNRSFTQGDTQCDKVAIKIGFSLYDNYIQGRSINAGIVLSHIVDNNFFKYSFYKWECIDE